MAAAAGAATLAQGRPAIWAWCLVLVGGLVEGTALGRLQGAVLLQRASAAARARFLGATVVVAGLGWAAASAPAAVAGDSGGDGGAPPLAVVLVGAAALGLVLGAVLGAAQGWALRGVVRHPWRWIGAGAAAWPGAMVVVFVGAALPGPSWPLPAVLLTGALTGGLAGAVLGVVSGWFLPALSGPATSARLVLRLLRWGRPRRLRRAVTGLAVRGRVTGEWIRLPVQYAELPADPGAGRDAALVAVPARPADKRWWRNLGKDERPVELLDEGRWGPAVARLLMVDDPAYEPAVAAYGVRWPNTPLEVRQPVVLVARRPPMAAADRRDGMSRREGNLRGQKLVGTGRLRRAGQLKRG